MLLSKPTLHWGGRFMARVLVGVTPAGGFWGAEPTPDGSR